MGKSDNVDLLGDPAVSIRSMVVPFLITLIVVQINVFADTFWVSNLGVDAVSGMTSAVPLYMALSVVGIGLSVGAVSSVAYRIGRGEPEAASRIAGNAIIAGLALSVVGSVIIYVLEAPLVDLMGAGDVSAEIHDYLLPYILLSPITVVNQILIGLLRAEGAAKRSSMAHISSVFFNMAMDPLLIYVLDLGVMGAGLATVLAYLLSLILAAQWYLRKKTKISISLKDFRPSKEYSTELLAVGGPRMAEGMINNIVILLQRVFIIIASGTAGVTLFNVPFRYVNLSMCPAEACGMASVPVIAAGYGQGNVEKMKTARRYTLRLALMFSVPLMFVLFIVSGPLIEVFTMEDSMAELYDELVWNLRMYCIILPLFTVQTVCASVLQALKKSSVPMRVSLLVGVFRMFAFWVASAYDFKAITVALIFSYVLSATLMFLLSRRYIGRIERQIASGA